MDAKPSPADDLEKLDSGCEDSSAETTDLERPGVLNNCYIAETQEENTQNSNNKSVQGGPATDLSSVEKQSQLLPVLLLSSTDELSARKSQELKTDTFTVMPPDDDDLCAPILLACLFCHPLDCLLATFSGCCWCLCSSIFCCKPTTAQSLLNITQNCNRVPGSSHGNLSNALPLTLAARR